MGLFLSSEAAGRQPPRKTVMGNSSHQRSRRISARASIGVLAYM